MLRTIAMGTMAPGPMRNIMGLESGLSWDLTNRGSGICLGEASIFSKVSTQEPTYLCNNCTVVGWPPVGCLRAFRVTTVNADRLCTRQIGATDVESATPRCH